MVGSSVACGVLCLVCLSCFFWRLVSLGYQVLVSLVFRFSFDISRFSFLVFRFSFFVFRFWFVRQRYIKYVPLHYCPDKKCQRKKFTRKLLLVHIRVLVWYGIIWHDATRFCLFSMKLMPPVPCTLHPHIYIYSFAWACLPSRTSLVAFVTRPLLLFCNPACQSISAARSPPRLLLSANPAALASVSSLLQLLFKVS